eukprot:Gregarina_sp_Poly_1__5522@NODE_2914_length_1557_cov_106_669799_g1824_i1_p1_GENE_NODE_2914_length_1557_cov_106_669799_g1824_i1NODE_2914_length_1557_cov_106_669799_g1824_i1_p1_ORF_typecomplete_len249_score41_05_NODE_2914_length_1557_cov_106_669799_g1824_i1128874
MKPATDTDRKRHRDAVSDNDAHSGTETADRRQFKKRKEDDYFYKERYRERFRDDQVPRRDDYKEAGRDREDKISKREGDRLSRNRDGDRSGQHRAGDSSTKLREGESSNKYRDGERSARLRDGDRYHSSYRDDHRRSRDGRFRGGDREASRGSHGRDNRGFRGSKGDRREERDRGERLEEYVEDRRSRHRVRDSVEGRRDRRLPPEPAGAAKQDAHRARINHERELIGERERSRDADVSGRGSFELKI